MKVDDIEEAINEGKTEEEKAAEKYQIEDCEANTENKEFFENAIKDKATWTLAYACDKLKDDRDLMMKCAKEDGQVLYYASQRLRDDKELVLLAVEQKWMIIKYASLRLRNDKDVAKMALSKNLGAKDYLGKDILKDEEIQLILNPPEENKE